MPFVAPHNVTPDDVARAMRLAARSTDFLLSAIVAVALLAILSQVLYAFYLYLRAASDAPGRLADLLLFRNASSDAVMAWLSIIVTMCLPAFLFYALRALVEAVRPHARVRRLMKTSDICGPTAYTIDNRGVRSTRTGGADVFMPWSSFDRMRSDEEIVALIRYNRLQFFIPLAAFGPQRDEVFALIRSNIPASPK